MTAVRRSSWLLIALVTVVLATPPAFGQADLSVTATNPTCTLCTAGQRVTIVNTVTNNGPDPDPALSLQLAAPYLGTTPVPDSWTTDVGEFVVDDQGNAVFADLTAMIYYFVINNGALEAGVTGTVTYQVDLDTAPPPVSDLTVNSPPDLAGPWGHRGGAFGQPFNEWNATADLEWVDDGSADPTFGCGPLIGFTPGHIALIDRGTCEFGAKALDAEVAGASAVIIANNDPAQDLSQILMGAGQVGDQVTIPALMIHYNDGTILRDRILVQGDTVNASVRHLSTGVDPWTMTTEPTGYPSMWSFGSNDPDDTNDLVYLSYQVTAQLFSDGFESGDTLAWSATEP
jgi:hypothetical protein